MKYRLICLDQDGVLFDTKNFWMHVHEAFGTLDEGARITPGLLASSWHDLYDRVIGSMWRGKEEAVYRSVVDSLPYMQGIGELFSFIKESGLVSCIISASSVDPGLRVKRDFGLDYVFANTMHFIDGRVAGTYDMLVDNDEDAKTRVFYRACADCGFEPSEAVFVGDTKGDADVLRAAGLGVAFNPQDREVVLASDVVVPSKDLRELVSVLRGYV